MLTETLVERVSANITLREATKSETASRLGINNRPGAKELANMKRVAETCFEPLRAHYDVPIAITSFFRCLTLNRSLGSSDSSFHVFGYAMDIDADVFGKLTNKQIFDFFYVERRTPFTELVWEYGTNNEPAWVHIAYNPDDKRKMVKQAYVEGGKKKIRTFNLY